MEMMDFTQKVFLGPMAGVTDLPFRLLCKRFGCDVMTTEMVSAKGLMYNPNRASELLLTEPEEGPIGVQLFGSEPEIMASEAAKLLERQPFDFIDINMGCPVPKIVGNGEGSALMKDPLLAGKIVEAIVKEVSVPVTAKIRAGFDAEHVNAPEMAHILEESGASAVAVHGRTREQFYSGKADWTVIKAVKERVKIPVIGNGDIRSREDALKMQEETGCDSVMIARAAEGNPWIFREIKDENADRPTIEERISIMLEHLALMEHYKGQYAAVHEMRKHIAWYTQGLHNSSGLRRIINTVESMDALKEAILSIEGFRQGRETTEKQ